MQPRHLQNCTPQTFHDIFQGFIDYGTNAWFYRGQADASWPLIPKAGRRPFFQTEKRYLDTFDLWSNQAVGYVHSLPVNDWERLALAQHFGLATCLLDWSLNPLVALYFACAAYPGVDGLIWCYHPNRYVDTANMILREQNSVGLALVPRAISPRIVSQRGVFTVHLPPDAPIEVDVQDGVFWNLIKTIVPAKEKASLLRMLDHFGVTRASLFPDLEGLSADFNSRVERATKSDPP